MRTWKLRLCKVAPSVPLAALFGYTCAIATDPALFSSQLNAVILAWLGLANVAALGVLGWALLTDRVDDLRVLIARSQANPRLRFMPPLQVVPDPQMPAAPVWPHVPQQQRHSRVYGEARPADRIEEELREITRDIAHPRPDDPRDMAS